MVKLSDLSDDELWLGIQENAEGIRKLEQKNDSLSAGKGLPRQAKAREEFISSNLRNIDKAAREIADFNEELQRRHRDGRDSPDQSMIQEKK